MKNALELHRQLKGKIEIASKFPIISQDDLALVYTPGVAEVSKTIAEHPNEVYNLTIKNNTIAIISDGSAVLGLGDIGPYAALPVMEGKAMLFKEFAGINAFPITLNTQNTYEIINLIKNISPAFAGINLEDIAAPRCFEIEDALQDIGIPVFHDDQHGTAIVLLAAMINASKVVGKKMTDLKVVINGAGAAGTAIANLLLCVGFDKRFCEPVSEMIICDSKGIIHRERPDLENNPYKMRLAKISNRGNVRGTLSDALKNADVFIGVSKAAVLDPKEIKQMAEKPIIFAMANPTPEIDPKDAKEAGAFIVGTGRSDYPNQINNLLAFPGVFLGVLNAHAKVITNSMKIGAARALASCVEESTVEKIVPSPLDKTIAYKIAQEVVKIYNEDQASPEA